MLPAFTTPFITDFQTAMGENTFIFIFNIKSVDGGYATFKHMGKMHNDLEIINFVSLTVWS